MLKVKLCLSAGIIICALLFPGSAFASSGSSNDSSHNSSFLNSFSQMFSKVFGNTGNNYGSNGSDKWKDNDDFENWFEKYKNDCPPESKYIWEKWYCS